MVGSPTQFELQFSSVTHCCVKLSEYKPNEQTFTHLPRVESLNVELVHYYSHNPVAKSLNVNAVHVWVQFPVILSIKNPYVQVRRHDLVTFDR